MKNKSFTLYSSLIDFVQDHNIREYAIGGAQPLCGRPNAYARDQFGDGDTASACPFNFVLYI